jgi:hypothetical protein
MLDLEVAMIEKFSRSRLTRTGASPRNPANPQFLQSLYPLRASVKRNQDSVGHRAKARAEFLAEGPARDLESEATRKSDHGGFGSAVCGFARIAHGLFTSSISKHGR